MSSDSFADPLVEELLSMLRLHSLQLRTAESCTAGGITARIAATSGVSDVLDRGWVTYSNQAKVEMLGVDRMLLDKYGAVSSEVVTAMAEGGTSSDIICVAVSGIAGPSGGSEHKPVGTVWISVALSGYVSLNQCFHLTGGRSKIQEQAVEHAIHLLIRFVSTTRN